MASLSSEMEKESGVAQEVAGVLEPRRPCGMVQP